MKSILFSSILFAAPFLFGGTAQATVRTVCASECDNTTVQAAIDASVSGDVINIGGETFTNTKITINKNITIEGQGRGTGCAGDTTLQGSSAGSVITVNSGVTATIRRLAIKGGVSAAGGGVSNLGNLTLEDAMVCENTSSGNGGGIHTGASSTLHTNNVQVQGNSGVLVGAGVFVGNGATLNAQNTIVLQNGTPNDCDHNGGTINSIGGNLFKTGRCN